MANLQDLIPSGKPKLTDVQLQNEAFNWEPKKAHQFLFSVIGTDGIGVPSYLVKASAKPSLTNGEIALDHINIKRYVKGKTQWNTIAITLYDAINPSGAESVMNWLKQHHEANTGRDGYSTHYKKKVKIQQLEATGRIIEDWDLHGTFITETNFGSLDWGSEETVNIEMTLRYDWAELKNKY